MTNEQAILISKQIVDNGYSDWLADQIRNLSRAKFETAPPEDGMQLMRARVVFDLAEEVRQVIIACSRGRES